MRAAALLCCVLLAACGGELTPEEQAQQDLQDIALVEQANQAAEPLEIVTPEPILLPDIERYDLLGAGCNYAPGTSLGTRVLARPTDAFVKIGGNLMRFAADPGARELPQGTRSLYTSKTHVLKLAITGDGEPSAGGKADYEGQIVLLDRHGRIAYEGVGLAQCGA
jgi:hypothetical protein